MITVKDIESDPQGSGDGDFASQPNSQVDCTTSHMTVT